MIKPSGNAIGDEAAAEVIRAHWTDQNASSDPQSRMATGDREKDAAIEAAARVWRDAIELGSDARFESLLGKPSLRERWVVFVEGMGDALAPVAVRAIAGCAALLLAIGLFATGFLKSGEQDFAYHTRVAEVRDIALQDGSLVTLGAKSTLAVELASNTREATLLEGEAFFSVSPNPDKPFFVTAGDTKIRVVGTKFNVNYAGGRVRVSVLEGLVEVVRVNGAGDRTPVRLTAGQQVIEDARTPALRFVGDSLLKAGSWRNGHLSYEDAALSDIVADASRYGGSEIVIASPELGAERITMSFTADQIDQMLDTLPDILPVRIRRHPEGRVSIEPLDS